MSKEKADKIYDAYEQIKNEQSNKLKMTVMERASTTNKIHNLNICEKCTIFDGEILVMRIPGGWIYQDRFYQKGALVYVPYNRDGLESWRPD